MACAKTSHTKKSQIIFLRGCAERSPVNFAFLIIKLTTSAHWLHPVAKKKKKNGTPSENTMENFPHVNLNVHVNMNYNAKQANLKSLSCFGCSSNPRI